MSKCERQARYRTVKNRVRKHMEQLNFTDHSTYNFNVADKNKNNAAEQTSNADTTSSEELEINDEDQRHSIPKFPNSRKDTHFTKTTKLISEPLQKNVHSLETQDINASFTKTAKLSASAGSPKKVDHSRLEAQEINHEPKGTNLNTERSSEPISENIGYQNKVLKLLEQISYEQKKLRLEIASLKGDVAVLKNTDKAVTMLKKRLFDSPANNEEELLCFEAQAKDPKITAQMITELSRIGGKTYKDITYHVMSRIMTNKLAQNYSLHGKKGKRSFISLKLSAIVIQAIMKSPGSANASMTDIKLRIGTFLAQSRDRDGGRKDRYSSSKHQEPGSTVQTRIENKNATDELQTISETIKLE